MKATFKEGNIRFPVVWHKKYLFYWQRLIRELGRRYTNASSLVLVHLSGPTIFSAEPILARNVKERRWLLENDFTEVAILRAWVDTAEAFKEAFPSQYLAFNFHYVVKSNLQLSQRILSKLKKLLCWQLALQGNWLDSEYLKKEWKFQQIFRQMSTQNILIGFQEIGPLVKRDRDMGLGRKEIVEYVRLTLTSARALGAVYLECYPLDIKFLGDIFAEFK